MAKWAISVIMRTTARPLAKTLKYHVSTHPRLAHQHSYSRLEQPYPGGPHVTWGWMKVLAVYELFDNHDISFCFMFIVVLLSLFL